MGNVTHPENCMIKKLRPTSANRDQDKKRRKKKNIPWDQQITRIVSGGLNAGGHGARGKVRGHAIEARLSRTRRPIEI